MPIYKVLGRCWCGVSPWLVVGREGRLWGDREGYYIILLLLLYKRQTYEIKSTFAVYLSSCQIIYAYIVEKRMNERNKILSVNF